MTEEKPVDESGVELAYAALAVFADDGKLELKELNSLLSLALRDGKITDSEKEVLRGVFDRVLEPDVSAETWNRIRELRNQHGI